MLRFLMPLWLALPILVLGQTNRYHISFENAVHHEAQITLRFGALDQDTLEVRMPRSSPGRYALHEFAKNVYRFKATDAQGAPLPIFRKDPYSWFIYGHNGEVNIAYTLFADRADGTYSQIDESHAHLNIPATFMYAPSLKDRPIEITFALREDLNWKVATQLPLLSGSTYTAPNLAYFMDSPTEISDFGLREFTLDGQKIRLALHHHGTEAELDTYFEKVKKVVLAQKEVYGELPKFDYGSYTFLACYLPHASGDGMEHRNSTILTSTRSLAQGGMERNIGTVSHEFFHAWNVERLRPKSLEPFDFSKANMSGALWFAEGFTSYYTNLILCRAGLIAPAEYVQGLNRTFNYVWNSPGRQFFSPVEMSHQAPFVDAATSVDPVNRGNTFISYYSYGSMLGLALDLALRREQLTLDGYMKLLWEAYGRNETPYTLNQLQEKLEAYAGAALAAHFFENYVHQSGMPPYADLFQSVGLFLAQPEQDAYFGANAQMDGEGKAVIKGYPKMGGPAYKAGLTRGDQLLTVNGSSFPNTGSFADFMGTFAMGDALDIRFVRHGKEQGTKVVLTADPAYEIGLMEQTETAPSREQLKRRAAWLGSSAP
ncbi:M61 family metallopeptidase [Maribacter sp. 2307ULW6-5]|uniref:M61 family metallopeptidase n=1 Tax=Maribacter sp. 2307ULW6-5 TaxID=3386275 RepID=UPI0039BCF95D